MNIKHLAAPATTMLLALAVAAPTAHAGEFAFSGKMFADVSQLDQRAGTNESRSWDADLKRLYLTTDYRYDTRWSAELTADVNWLRGQRDPDLWVRHAYVQRRFGTSGAVKVGVADLPVGELVSRYYGYRYVEQLGTSREKLDVIADWGVHLQGKLLPQLSYAVAVVTGGGYKRPTVGHRADAEALLAYTPSKHTVLALGGYDGRLAQDGDPAAPAHHDARRIDVLAAYADDTWRLGVRYAYASNWKSVRAMAGDRARSWSGWTSYRFAPAWSAFARYDLARPGATGAPLRQSRYAEGGLQWDVRKAWQLALVAKHNALERNHATLSRSNEIGLWTQLSF